MKSTPKSRAVGLALALAGVILGMATIIGAPSLIARADWPAWAMVTAYLASLAVGAMLGTVSATAMFYWFETRRSRRAKH